jgi:gamma-glutamyl-gamma-aminobutyrate hydrolase PuuD
LPNQPVIAITAGSDDDGRLYSELISRCGGLPLLITPDSIGRHDQLGIVGGLLLGNAPADFDNGASLVLSDTMTRLLPTVLDFDLPVVAVGDGMHSLNMAMGGGRPLPVNGHEGDEDKAARHHIYVAPGSRLASIVGAGGFVRVNSLHRLGMRDAQRSPELMTAAYAVEDGIIEAVESPDYSLVIGVQFRPDRPREVPPNFDNLFHLLVERAGR